MNMDVGSIIGSVIATILGAGVIGIVMMAVQVKSLASAVDGLKETVKGMLDERKEIFERLRRVEDHR